jgi:hypothetical protein
MKTPFRKSKPQRGFTLILVMSMLMLLVMIGVGVLSLSAVTLRQSTNERAMVIARSNARMALQLALGDLQKSCGRDQSVTAHARLIGGDSKNAQWTGVWRTNNTDAEPHWLVSQSNPSQEVDPLDDLSGQKVTVVSKYDQQEPVEVPLITVATAKDLSSRYAYWVSDEASKARINLQSPDSKSTTDLLRLAHSSLATEYGLAAIDDAWGIPEIGKVNQSALTPTLATSALATENTKIPKQYQHDITTEGYGLPVNVVDGGMKKDLSVIFDTTSTLHSRLMQGYFGATPQAKSQTQGGSTALFTAPSGANGKKFFLLDDISSEGRTPVGPNWGNLYNYYQLHKNARNGNMAIIAPEPSLYNDIRLRNWAPYTQHKMQVGSEQFHDTQHLNQSLRPTISLLQMGFRLKSRLVTPAAGSAPARYRILLQVKPLVGLWNPYNIGMTAQNYSFEWGLFSYLRLKITSPTGQVTTPRLWTRELWDVGNSRDGMPDKWIRLLANSVDFRPGEMRMFSVASPASISADNTVQSTWGSGGAFEVEAKYNGTGGGPASGFIDVPAGSTVQVEEICWEDRQHPETLVKWPSIADRYSTTWFTLKVTGAAINRFQDLWASGKKQQWEMPERVKPVSAPAFSVEQLAAVHEHLATYSLRLRNGTESHASQNLRGWFDCNPTAFAMNPRWDGSKANGNLDGFWFSAPFFSPASQGVPRTDGGPDGRGLIALGSGANETPQANTTGGRYQGYGGSSSISSSGQSQVPIYDVPRAPLFSLAQFQHAEVSRYNHESALPIGNSYANPRLAGGALQQRNFNGIAGFTLVDQSYLLNQKLWDQYFFSTLSSLHKGSTQAIDTVYPLQSISYGKVQLPNPRMMVLPLPGDTRFSTIMSRDQSIAAESIAARIAVMGAFNVNSTSKDAWKAMLGSLAGHEWPTLNSSGRLTWSSKNKDVVFSHFSVLLDDKGYINGTAARDLATWGSNRIVSENELDELAEQIVEEVKARGPFLSLADFVNRDPKSSTVAHQRKGALQAALDASLNASIPDSIGKKSKTPDISWWNHSLTDESLDNQAAGHSCFVSQADVLQSIGPVLQVRSDAFRIRAVGEARDSKNNRLLARALCEAQVQRQSRFLDESDRAETPLNLLKSPTNRAFGRRFVVTSFRWLDSRDI